MLPSRGTIATSWSRDAGRLNFRVELPPNTTASVRLASADPAAVRAADGSRPDRVAAFPGAPGISEAVFEIGSGSWEFAGPDRLAADRAPRISGDKVQP